MTTGIQSWFRRFHDPVDSEFVWIGRPVGGGGGSSARAALTAKNGRSTAAYRNPFNTPFE